MGNKVGNHNPPQSRESLAHTFEEILESSTEKGNYLVGNKNKDKHEIDGVARGDITYLSQKSKKHGPAAAAYRLSGRRKAHYKGARIYLQQLAAHVLTQRSDFNNDQIIAAQSIKRVLRKSKSKGCVKIDAIRNDLKIILAGIKTTAQISAEAVTNDYGHDAGNISHFLDDVEIIKSGQDSQLVRENVRKQGGGNVQLLDQITLVNTWAKTIKLQPQTVHRLKLKTPSFTAPAGETAVNNLLGKIADWPGSNLQLKLAFLFERAKPEHGSEAFKAACKEVLLELAKQKFVLSSISEELLNTIEDENDREELRSLGQSVKNLLVALDSDSPFKRLEDLARAGYYWPKDTAPAVVEQRSEFLRSSMRPISTDAVQPAPVVNGQPVPVNGQVPLGNGQLPPVNAQQLPVHGQLPPVNAQPVAVHGQPAAGNGQPAAINMQSPVVAGNSAFTARPLPSVPANVAPLSGQGQSASVNAQPVPVGGQLAPGNVAQPVIAGISAASGIVAKRVAQFSNSSPHPASPVPGGAAIPPLNGGPLDVPPPDDMPPPPAAALNVPPASMPVPASPVPGSTAIPPLGGWPSNVPPPDDMPPPPAAAAINVPPASIPVPASPVPGSAAIPPLSGSSFDVPPPDDMPPPPSNVGQASQPAVPAGGPPQPAATTNPALPSPPVKASPGDTLPPPNIDGVASVPPPDYMPAPPQNGPLAPANGTMAAGKLPPPVHYDVLPPSDMPPPPGEPTRAPREANGKLNPAEKAAAAVLTTRLDIPPIPEGEPPQRPDNLPPPVLNGVLVPLSSLQQLPDREPPPADPLAKAAVAKLFSGPGVSPARGDGDIPPPPISAAKLLADLTSSDRTHLTASKVDDGTGHRVVTKKGKVLFLKASSGQEEGGLRALMNNGLRGRRGAQYQNTKKALAALLEDAELRGLTATENLHHAAPMAKHAIELGKDGVKFDDFTRRHVATILAEDVKRQQDAAERQDRIATLFAQSKEPQSKDPEAAVDEFFATNGSDFEKNKKEIFFKKLGDRVGVTKPSASTIDESSLSSVDQWNYKFTKAVDHFIGLTQEMKKMTTRPEHLKEGEDFYILPLSFYDDTRSFVEKNMPHDVSIFTSNIVVESTVIFAQGLVSQVNQLMGVISQNKLTEFKGGMGEIKRISEKAFRQLEFLARLFTNEQYLAQVPIEGLALFRRYGEALQQIALGVLDPKGPYIAFYRMAEAAGTSPETTREYFRKVFGLDEGKGSSANAQAGESKPPSKPVPPVPTYPKMEVN